MLREGEFNVDIFCRIKVFRLHAVVVKARRPQLSSRLSWLAT